MTDLDPQPVPERTRCPDCGGHPSAESQATHRLSAVGYLHDDQRLECGDCGREWTVGVPVGQSDGGTDLHCDSCKWDRSEPVRMLVHRVEWQGGTVNLHLKCPECYYFRVVTRESDSQDVALVGYPQITGETDGATAYGYPADGS